MCGWVKLHRSIIEWEWFTDPNTLTVFIWLLAKANHKPTNWRGKTIDRGQILTGRKQIAAATKVSEKSVRTALNHLKSTNEVAIESTNQFSIITICNYKHYQRDERDDDQPTGQLTGQQRANDGPATGQQRATSNNDNKLNNEKNEKNEKKDTPVKDWLYKKSNPKFPLLFFTEDEVKKMNEAYSSMNLNIFHGLEELQGWAEDNPVKFKKKKSHYRMMIGWVMTAVADKQTKFNRLNRSYAQ